MQPTKKLIYISHWRFPSEKTMSPLIMRTCQEFADQGFEVELWVPRRLNKAMKEVDPYTYHNTKKNFKIRKLLALDFVDIFGGKIGFYMMLGSFSGSLFLKALFEKNAIFYSHDSRDIFFLSFLNREVFVEIHDFYESSISFINSLVLKRAKGIISTNLIKAKKIEAKYGILPEKILHKPNAVDIEMFDPKISREEARVRLGLDKDKKIILYTGSLFYWKGVDTLLETSKYLELDVYFVGGTDEDVKNFKSEAENISNVYVEGRKPMKDIPLWQRAANVLVLPNTAKHEESRIETSPVKLFEYMASGTPIIASDVPSIRNIVDERHVTFFKADNSESLAEKIGEVLAGGEETKAKVIASKEEVKKHSWQKRIGDIVKFILSNT